MDGKWVKIIAALMVTESEYYNYYKEDLFAHIKKFLYMKYNYENATALNKKYLDKKIKADYKAFVDSMNQFKAKAFKIEKALIASLGAETVDKYIEHLHNALDTLE